MTRRDLYTWGKLLYYTVLLHNPILQSDNETLLNIILLTGNALISLSYQKLLLQQND